MKKSFLFYFGLLLCIFTCTAIYYGCKKKSTTAAATCSDGIQNQGETGIDCGGPCTACAVVAPCSLGTNKVKFSGPITNGATNVYTVSCSGTGKYSIAGTCSAGDVTVILPSLPTADRTYTLSNDPLLAQNDPNQATIDLRETFGYVYYPNSGQTLYVNVSGGKVKATFCNINFQSNSATGTYVGSGTLICP